jgi:hypothetical protein
LSLLLSRSHSSYSSSRFSSSKNNINLPDYAFIYLPIHLSVHLSIYLSIYPSIFMHMPIFLPLTHSLSCIQPHAQGALPLSPFPPPSLLTILVLSPPFSFFLYCVLHEVADGARVAPCALQFYRARYGLYG